MGNPIPVGNDLPRGGADLKNSIHSDMQAGYEKAQGYQYPSNSRPDACQKLCFGSLEEFLGCFPEPEPAIPPLSAPGFAIVAEPLGCGDCLMESGLSHGATVCAIVPQPPNLHAPPREAIAIPAQQLVHQGAEACNSPVHDTVVTSSGTTLADASPSAELASALAESASPTAVVSMSPAVGPATPAAVQEVLYPETQEQLHAASGVNDTEGDDTPDELSSDMSIGLPCIRQAVLVPSWKHDVYAAYWSANVPYHSPTIMSMLHRPKFCTCSHPHTHDLLGGAIHDHVTYGLNTGPAALFLVSFSSSSDRCVLADAGEDTYQGSSAPSSCRQATASANTLPCAERQALLNELADIQVMAH